MQIGGHEKGIDYQRLGPSLIIAASLILAIRTVKKMGVPGESLNTADWDGDVRDAVKIAHLVLAEATVRHPGLFQHKNVPWYKPSDDDVVE